MKISPKARSTQKRLIQQKLDRLSPLREPLPAAGWVKAIRGSLGLTIRQLAKRVGVTHGTIAQIEKREPTKQVTLESLEKVAQAMNCRLVYAILPQEAGLKLDDILEKKALEAATRILNEVQHTMRLEAQGVSQKQLRAEIKRIALSLLEKNDPRVWDSEEKPKPGKKNASV